MATAHDVANYILQRQDGEMTTWKLQKLVYYAQAWHTAWTGRPLFSDRIEAWANGPVTPALYQQHRGQFTVRSWPIGNPDNLSNDEQKAVDGILDFYGDKTGQWLSDLTHSEPPWQRAREGLLPTERGSREITPQYMAEYYGGLVA
jgi:uncharacterized phage-associated protein